MLPFYPFFIHWGICTHSLWMLQTLMKIKRRENGRIPLWVPCGYDRPALIFTPIYTCCLALKFSFTTDSECLFHTSITSSVLFRSTPSLIFTMWVSFFLPPIYLLTSSQMSFLITRYFRDTFLPNSSPTLLSLTSHFTNAILSVLCHASLSHHIRDIFQEQLHVDHSFLFNCPVPHLSVHVRIRFTCQFLPLISFNSHFSFYPYLCYYWKVVRSTSHSYHNVCIHSKLLQFITAYVLIFQAPHIPHYPPIPVDQLVLKSFWLKQFLLSTDIIKALPIFLHFIITPLANHALILHALSLGIHVLWVWDLILRTMMVDHQTE